MQPTYPDLDAIHADLGLPSAEFKPAFATLVGWLILYGIGLLAGLACVGAAIGWIVYYGSELPLSAARKSQPSWFNAGALLLSGVAAGLPCGMLFRLKWQALSDRILVYPDGFI